MSAAKKRKSKSPIFDHIRKPTAPPTRQIGQSAPEEKLRPSGRGAKHKKKEEPHD